MLISAELYRTKIADTEHDGQWLLAQAARVGFDIPTPSRAEDRGDTAFES